MYSKSHEAYLLSLKRKISCEMCMKLFTDFYKHFNFLEKEVENSLIVILFLMVVVYYCNSVIFVNSLM